MLALPLRPLDATLAATSNYLPHQALHLAAPPIPGPSDQPATTASCIWSALSFYESVPRAISPAPSTTRAQHNTDVVYSTPSVPPWDHLITHRDDALRPITRTEHRPSHIDACRPPSPSSDPSHLPSSYRRPSCLPSADDAPRGNAGLAHSRSEHEHGRVQASASGPPTSLAPPFLCRSVPPHTASSSIHVTSRRPRRTESDLPAPSSSFGIPDVSRVVLSDPDPEPTEEDSEFERKFVSLAPHRRKVKTVRGPYARSPTDVQRLVPPFGAPRCLHAECTDAKCATCAYLRRRGDSVLRTKLLKRDKDRDLWHLHAGPGSLSEEEHYWPYAEDRWKLQALQASYVLGRELALQAQAQARSSKHKHRSRARL